MIRIGSLFIILLISVGSILYAIIQKSEAAKIFAEQILKKTSDSLIILHARIREMEASLKKVKKANGIKTY